MNAIFQVIQNILRRTEQQSVCPHCGRPLPPGVTDAQPPDPPQTDAARDPDVPRCPNCGRPLPDDAAP